MTEPRLLGLPEELHRAILQSLSTAHLRSLCLACKALRKVTEPVLYSRLLLEWRHDRGPRIDLLLRSLLSQPQLADHAHSLLLSGDRFGKGSFEPWRPDVPCLSVVGLPMRQACDFIDATALTKSCREEWRDQLKLGSVDALVTLLVSLLPNVAHLQLGRLFTIDNKILGQLLRQSLCDGPSHAGKTVSQRFSHLQTVELPRRQDESRRTTCNNSANVLPLFYLSSIRDLKVSIDNAPEFAWPAAAPNPTTLTSLALSRIREHQLKLILGSLQNLEKLSWEWYYQSDLDASVSDNTIHLDAISTAMATTRNTLKELIIRAETGKGRQDLEKPRLQMNGSLKRLASMEKLERLQVPWVFVMGFSPSARRNLLEGVPWSLRTLVLTEGPRRHDQFNWHADGRFGEYDSDDNEDPCIRTNLVISALERLERSKLPNLHLVVLGWGPDEEQTDEQDAKLEHIAVDPGVNVVWDREAVRS